MAKQRQSNIELCRIVSILLVLLVHTTFYSLGKNVSFGVMLLAGFSIIGVNVFVLITGYFSATPKKTSLINLAFICLFWMIVKIIIKFSIHDGLSYQDFFFISGSNWFVPAYICLLLLTPLLNNYCNSLSNSKLWGVGVVIALLLLEVWFDWLPPKVDIGFEGGYSVYHFIVLYLIARAIKLHGLPEWFKKTSPIIYLACSLLLALLSYVNKKVIPIPVSLFAYNNPIVVISSIAFLTTFERLKLKYSNVINHLAKSTLAVLLGHYAIIELYRLQFKYLYDNYTGFNLLLYWLLAVMSVFICVIIIDQLRIWLYRPISDRLNKSIKNNDLFKG